MLLRGGRGVVDAAVGKQARFLAAACLLLGQVCKWHDLLCLCV
jgi:hypothetical protein